MLLSLALLSVCNDGYLVLSQPGSPSSIGLHVHIQLASHKNNLLEGVYYFIRRRSAKLIRFALLRGLIFGRSLSDFLDHVEYQ